MKLLTAAADGFFLTRPVLLIPVWGFSVLGYGRAMSLRDGHVWLWGVSTADVHAFILMIVFSMTVAVVYILNQLADRQVDADNPGFALMAAGKVPPLLGWVSAVVLCFASLLVLIIYDRRLAVAGLVSMVIGVLYCFKPTAFSGRPGFDFISNGIGYGAVAFGAGWVVAPGHGDALSFTAAAVPYVLLMCSGSISSTIPDIAGDLRHGKRTTAVCLGAARAHLLATAILVAAGVCALIEGDFVALACAVCSLPLYLAYAVVKNQKLQESTYKIGGGMVMLAAVAVLPWLAAVAAVTVAVTFVYFRVRFGVMYPSLLPARSVHTTMPAKPESRPFRNLSSPWGPQDP